MAISLNTNNVATDAQGRTTFSGVSSGINAKQIVDSVIKAREVRTDKLSAEIKTNEDKIAAYNALTQKTAEVRNSLKELYGRITADKSANVFDRKSLSASTSKRSALVNETVNTKVSAATDLLSATAANTTATGSHEIEILQIAAAHSLRAMFGGGGALGGHHAEAQRHQLLGHGHGTLLVAILHRDAHRALGGQIGRAHV